MDKGFRRLLKRLLKNFAADSRQRELSFPGNLSSADRYCCQSKSHMAAVSVLNHMRLARSSMTRLSYFGADIALAGMHLRTIASGSKLLAAF
jgi:hypothetical protein